MADEPGAAALNGDACAVELLERKALKRLVVRVALIAKDADGDGFAEGK